MENAIQPTQRNHDEVKSHSAPFCVLSRVSNDILEIINSTSSAILITGEAGKGKSTLLDNVSKEVSSDHRLINFNGINFLIESPNQDKNVRDFNAVKEFIYESINLEENILILVDSADFLPADILDQLIKLILQNKSSKTINLILAGLPKLKLQLFDDEKGYAENLVHFSLDEITNEDIEEIASIKDYKNKPINGELKFNKSSLNEIGKYINGDPYLLDVILEWCSIITKENNVSLVTRELACKAIAALEDFAHESSVSAYNAYPTAYEIKTITKQEEDTDNDNELEIPLLNEIIQEKASDTTGHDSLTISETQKDSHVVSDALKIATDELHENETEIMPVQWVPKKDKKSKSKKPLISLSFVIVILSVGLIMLINQRMQTNLINDDGNIPDNKITSSETLEKKENSVIGLNKDNNLAYINNNEVSTKEETTATPFHKNTKVQSTVMEQPEPTMRNQDQLVATQSNTSGNVSTTINSTSDKSKSTNITENDQTAQIENNINPAQPLDELPQQLREELPGNAQTISDDQESLIDKSEIKRLLVTAEQQIAIKHLTTPYEDSAYKSYKTIPRVRP